jgi:uncharacterized protein (TIGR03083 family)
MKGRTAALKHTAAITLAETEYQRCLALFRTLEPADWDRPTDCPGWDVRQMACHMLGMAEMVTSVREMARQQGHAGRAARQSGRAEVDELTELQVDEKSNWTPSMIIERWASQGPRAAAGRRRIPSPLRGLKGGTQRVNGADEPWTMGYITDVILTRDPWMHRIDITRATGATLVLTADHDGVLVADVINEWSDRHGKDYTLTLEGTAGGTWTVGANGPEIRADAVEFCRALSGRRSQLSSDDILSTEVPF